MGVVIDKRILESKSPANYLSISRSKLYQWVDAGKIPGVRINNKRLFDVIDLDEFVNSLKENKN